MTNNQRNLVIVITAVVITLIIAVFATFHLGKISAQKEMERHFKNDMAALSLEMTEVDAELAEAEAGVKEAFSTENLLAIQNAGLSVLEPETPKAVQIEAEAPKRVVNDKPLSDFHPDNSGFPENGIGFTNRDSLGNAVYLYHDAIMESTYVLLERDGNLIQFNCPTFFRAGEENTKLRKSSNIHVNDLNLKYQVIECSDTMHLYFNREAEVLYMAENGKAVTGGKFYRDGWAK